MSEVRKCDSCGKYNEELTDDEIWLTFTNTYLYVRSVKILSTTCKMDNSKDIRGNLDFCSLLCFNEFIQKRLNNKEC